MPTRALVTYALVLTAALLVSFVQEHGALEDPTVLETLAPRQATPLAMDLLLVWGFAGLAIKSRLFEPDDRAAARSTPEGRLAAASPDRRLASAQRQPAGAGHP